MTSPDAFDHAVWSSDNPDAPDDAPPPDRPTTWNGKPIPDNALWSDDGVTPLTTPTGRIRRSRGPRPNSGKVTPGVKPKQVDLAAVEADMVLFMAQLGMVAAVRFPTVGMVAGVRGEPTARAMVTACKNSPRMLAAMQRASTVGPLFELATTGVMLVAAVALDTGRAQVTDPIAIITGVADLHRMVNPNAGQAEDPVVPPFGMPSGPVDDAPPFTTQNVTGDIGDPDHVRYSFAANGGRPPGAGDVTPLRGGPFGGTFPA
jgi:hypothetical protein